MNWQKELQSMVDEMRERGKKLLEESERTRRKAIYHVKGAYSEGYEEAVCFVADEIQKMFAKAEEERE